MLEELDSIKTKKETIICQCNLCKSKRRTEKKENIKDYIEFIRFQYKDLIEHEGVCKKEVCLKIREMLCHILNFKPKTETGKLLECHGCGVVIPDHRYWCFDCMESSKKQFKEGYKQTLDNIIKGFIIIVKELKLAFKEKVLELKDFTEAETIVKHLRKD